MDASNRNISLLFQSFLERCRRTLMAFWYPFPVDFLLQVAACDQGKCYKNQLSSRVCCFESFLLLSKLNFQFFPGYSASDSTCKTSWLILFWTDLVSSSWDKLQFPFFLPTASSNCVTLMSIFSEQEDSRGWTFLAVGWGVVCTITFPRNFS